jgi:glucose/arabinose dehydrogenase
MKSVVARMTSTDGGKTFGSYVELFSFDQPFTNHKGGDAHFGNDGYLYLSFGDGGSGGDPYSHGQNTNLYFSKILRVDVDGTQNGNYGIPPTNPFATGGGQPETFAYGFRNPFRFTIDRATGEPWVADVGQDTYEEVDPQVKARVDDDLRHRRQAGRDRDRKRRRRLVVGVRRRRGR